MKRKKNLALLLAYMKTRKELVNIRMSLTYFINNCIAFIIYKYFFVHKIFNILFNDMSLFYRLCLKIIYNILPPSLIIRLF